MSEVKVWILNSPAAPNLRLLEQLPGSTHIVVGESEEAFENAPDPDVVVCGIGKARLLRALWPRIQQARWLHSLTAGLESVLFPELVESPITMTNAKGVYGRSLGEFAIASALYFAKDFPRMIRSRQAGVWDPFDVEELTGRTFGIVGYGGIGREAARRAKAMGMKVLAVRRHPAQSASDPLIDGVYAPDGLREMLALCDYVLVAAPNTPETNGMIGEAELRAMKPEAVLINLGRGPVIDEAALIAALEERRIKGAALDVFNQEPLPEGHAFYGLDNVLLSPHCADHTPGWLDESMQFFVDNFGRFVSGEPLQNLVNKKLGY
ncbi:MAG: Glyoxylate/hydroxypyruvate reductase B [Bryobacteraceae bacterium]|nr:Glyoxylate/hydroxypyruvate reductase B [Bryobacteraceae bacterium]